MSRVIENLELDPNDDLHEHLAWKYPDLADFRILRQSVDARRRKPKMIYSVEIAEGGEGLSQPVIEVQERSWDGDMRGNIARFLGIE